MSGSEGTFYRVFEKEINPATGVPDSKVMFKCIVSNGESPALEFEGAATDEHKRHYRKEWALFEKSEQKVEEEVTEVVKTIGNEESEKVEEAEKASSEE